MTLRKAGLRTGLLLGSALALPLVGAATPALAAHRSSGWSAPSESVVLTREVRHALGDGKEIVGKRSYRLTFSRNSSGWTVDGALIFADVVAPAELAPLAAMEKARKDDGLFPLFLDKNGLIVTQGNPADIATGDQARSLAKATIGAMGLAPSDHSLAREMVERISGEARTRGANWPQDLFNPAPGEQSQVRTMTLPDGREGRITMIRNATGAAGAALHKLERDVVTELGGTRRVNREIFTIAASR